MTSYKDLVIKCSNRETPEKQIVKTDQNGNDETSKGEMEVMLPDNELYKFIELQPITSIFREQVSMIIIVAFKALGRSGFETNTSGLPPGSAKNNADFRSLSALLDRFVVCFFKLHWKQCLVQWPDGFLDLLPLKTQLPMYALVSLPLQVTLGKCQIIIYIWVTGTNDVQE